jgi:hypothetical protein
MALPMRHTRLERRHAAALALLATALTASTPAPLTTSAAQEVDRLVRSLPRAQAVRRTQAPPKRKTWIARHPGLVGAPAGFGAGCAIGASQVGGSKDTFFNALDELACPVTGGVGGGIGWVIGRSFR